MNWGTDRGDQSAVPTILETNALGFQLLTNYTLRRKSLENLYQEMHAAFH